MTPMKSYGRFILFIHIDRVRMQDLDSKVREWPASAGPRRLSATPTLSLDHDSALELPRFGGHVVVLDPISYLPRFYRSYNAARSAAGRRQKL